LADALSNGVDLPTARQELGILRAAAETAAKRMEELEVLNSQLQGRIEGLEREIAQLRLGTVDLRSEEDLMREVLAQQSEQLVRKVEDLTDERKTADADRKQLLSLTADLLRQVESANARLARRSELEAASEKLDAESEALRGEVERLRRTNGALCQQVLGEDGDGPLAGVLSDPDSHMHVDDEETRLLNEAVCRLIRGRSVALPGGSPTANVRTDASSLALRLQTLIAEREESFWVEQQRLSDRVAALDRARGGRTGALLREYGAAARGAPAGEKSSSAGTGAASAVAAATAGMQRLRGAVGW